jgi:hypothetical protein
LSFEDYPKGKFPKVKFDFDPLNLNRPQLEPKMGKSLGVKLEFGAQRWAKAPR